MHAKFHDNRMIIAIAIGEKHAMQRRNRKPKEGKTETPFLQLVTDFIRILDSSPML